MFSFFVDGAQRRTTTVIVGLVLAAVGGCDSGATTTSAGSAPGPNVDKEATDREQPSVAAKPTPQLRVDLSIRHQNRYPTRLAIGPDGKIYVTDPLSGSVFIYDANLKLKAELAGLDKPLGVAVDTDGRIIVGNDGRNNIEIFTPSGELVAVVDEGNIGKPNDIALDRDGNIYAAASKDNTVKVYSPEGKWLRNIGGQAAGAALSFPAAVAIAYRGNDGATAELFVADQGNAMVRVFALNGTLLRSFGGRPKAGSDSKGRFIRLQSLARDGKGRLHAVDCFSNQVQVLDPDSGAHIESYGHHGTKKGELNLPLDVAISGGQVLVANAENHRVEAIHAVQ